MMKILYILLGLLFGSLMFVAGWTFEFDDHVEDRSELLFERDSIQGLLDHHIYNADWNALKNIETSAITTNCDECNPMVSKAFERLDTRRVQRGKIGVVPSNKKIRNLNDR